AMKRFFSFLMERTTPSSPQRKSFYLLTPQRLRARRGSGENYGV
ncbi:hypothetical protein NPIL_644051, partial [Nephila pilipes]